MTDEMERRFGIDHTGIGVADIAASARFYDAALGALGMTRRMQVSTEGRFVETDIYLGGVGYALTSQSSGST